MRAAGHVESCQFSSGKHQDNREENVAMKGQTYIERISPSTENVQVASGLLCGKAYNHWDALPGQVRNIFECAGKQSVFLSRAWFENLSQTALSPEQEVRFFSVEDSSGKNAPLLLLPTHTKRNTLFRPRTLSSLTNFYTPLFAPLISSDCESQSVFQVLAMTIAADCPRWDIVNLRWLDKDSVNFGRLRQAFKAAGFVVQTYFCAGNWYEPIHERNYEDYMQGLRSAVRNIARSKVKKIERSGRARIELISGGEALSSAIGDYEQIYGSSWKTDEPYPRFMPGLLRAFAAAGWLRLAIAYVDEEPAAAQVWFVANRIASIYKMAYNPKFKDLSVGSYLTMYMIRHSIDLENVTEIDYLTGDDNYKRDWMSHRRERWGILAMNPNTPRGLAAIARHVGGRAVKRVVQRILRDLRRPETHCVSPTMVSA